MGVPGFTGAQFAVATFHRLAKTTPAVGMGCRSSPLCSAVCRCPSPSRNGRGRGSDRRTPHDDGTCAGGDCHSEAGGVGVYLEAIGTVTPIYTDSITAQVTGHITAGRDREGQLGHKGDPLIELDARA